MSARIIASSPALSSPASVRDAVALKRAGRARGVYPVALPSEESERGPKHED